MALSPNIFYNSRTETKKRIGEVYLDYCRENPTLQHSFWKTVELLDKAESPVRKIELKTHQKVLLFILVFEDGTKSAITFDEISILQYNCKNRRLCENIYLLASKIICENEKKLKSLGITV